MKSLILLGSLLLLLLLTSCTMPVTVSNGALHITLAYECRRCGRLYEHYLEADRCHHAGVFEVRLWIGRKPIE